MDLTVVAFFAKYKDVLITVGWLLAALGWTISNRQANNREMRKETRSEVDAICKAAAEVIGKCRSYYAAGPSADDDDAKAAEIAFEVKRILIRTERLNRRLAKFKPAVLAGGEFFDAVTQEPFQSKNRPKIGPGSRELEAVETGVHNLIDKLEEGFTSKFF
jgi:hypothetical protein